MDDLDDWSRQLAGSEAERATRPLRICQMCVTSLRVSGAGISMVTTSGNRGVVCATDAVSSRIEELQLTLGEGPCVDAVRAGGPVLLSDLEEPGDLAIERWPAFMRAAEGAGIRAIFAFPLQIGAIRVGALDLYRDRPGEMDDGELSAALLAADAGALALLQLDIDGEDPFSDDVGAHRTYQLQVHQATGMVQVQLGVNTDEAFLMLRARAFASGRRLADLASDVVERRIRFSPEDG